MNRPSPDAGVGTGKRVRGVTENRIRSMPHERRWGGFDFCGARAMSLPRRRESRSCCGALYRLLFSCFSLRGGGVAPCGSW